MIDWAELGGLILILLTSALLGGVLGFEREAKGQWAGLRTHMLVSLGSAVFVLIGAHVGKTQEVDISRVIQGIATGIGFIGAGTIIKLTEKQQIKGLTTASSVWLSAAVGTAVGVQYYSLAVIGTVFALVVLTALQRVDRWIDRADLEDESKLDE